MFWLISMPSLERIVLVAYGPVGARFVEELLPSVRAGHVQLTVVGAETAEAYNRVLIAEYAVGNTEREALDITDTEASQQAVNGGGRARRADQTEREYGTDRAPKIGAATKKPSVPLPRHVLPRGANRTVRSRPCKHRPSITNPVLHPDESSAMTVIKINAITVPADSGDELAQRFAARAGAVDGQAGFEGFELLRPTDADRHTWLVITRWADEESFQAWVSSPAFGHGRGQKSESAPKESTASESAEQARPAPSHVGLSSELWSYEIAGGSEG